MYGLEAIRRINADFRASGASVADFRASLPAAVPVQPSGHLPDGSSVQKHSAGEVYPFVVYRQGERDHVMVNGITVGVPSVETAHQLVAEARAVKRNDPSIDLGKALHRVAVINGFSPAIFGGEAA